jgi:hypothetical protein
MKNLNLVGLTLLSAGLALVSGVSHAQTTLAGSFNATGGTVASTGTAAYNGTSLATSTSVTFSYSSATSNIISYSGATGTFSTSGAYNVNLAGTSLGTYKLNVANSNASGASVTYTFGSTTLAQPVTFTINKTGTTNAENFTFTANGPILWWGVGTNDVHFAAAGALVGTGNENLGLVGATQYNNALYQVEFIQGQAAKFSISTPEPGAVALLIGFGAPLAGFAIRRRK